MRFAYCVNCIGNTVVIVFLGREANARMTTAESLSWMNDRIDQEMGKRRCERRQ